MPIKSIIYLKLNQIIDKLLFKFKLIIKRIDKNNREKNTRYEPAKT